MTEIALHDLAAVTGGAEDIRAAIQKKYKAFVCDFAGAKGRDELAQKLWGKNASQADIEAAGRHITALCNERPNLPADAPKLPTF